MRSLIVSDIHGNATAFDSLLESVGNISGLEIDTYFILGDLFGYYWDPLRVWEKALPLDPDLRLGNHDDYLRQMIFKHTPGVGIAESELVAWTNILHREMLERAAPEMSAPILAHLARADVDQPRVMRSAAGDGYWFVLVHAAPFMGCNAPLAPSPADYYQTYLYAKTRNLFRECLHRALTSSLTLAQEHGAQANERIILWVGHTHMPMIAYLDGDSQVCFKSGSWTNQEVDSPIQLDELFQHFPVIAINPGAVGLPRVSALARHANAAHIDTATGMLRMIALDLRGRVLEQICLDMASWEACDLLPAIDEPLRAFYDKKASVVTRETTKAHYLAVARMSHKELCEYWAETIRPQMINAFVAGAPQSPDDAYIYTPQQFQAK